MQRKEYINIGLDVRERNNKNVMVVEYIFEGIKTG